MMAGVKCRVIIIGAGLAGLATSIALSCDGHTVTLLERAEQLTRVLPMTD